MVHDHGHARFQEQGFVLLGLDAKEDFLRKGDGAFRHGINIAGKAQLFQIVQEFLAEKARTLQVRQVIIAEVDVFYIVDEMFQPGDDRIPSFKRITSIIAVKHALLLVLAFKK